MERAASPRSAARTASTPAGALEAVSRWTPQAAAIRSRSVVTQPSRAAAMRLLTGRRRRPQRASAAAGLSPPVRARAAERVGVRGRSHLEARADERHRGARHVEVADGDAHLITASTPRTERDERVPAAVAEAPPWGSCRRGADERASHRAVDDDAGAGDEEHAGGGERRVAGQVERAAPDEPAAGAREPDAESAHVDRLTRALAPRGEWTRIAEVAHSVAVGVGLRRVRDARAVVLRVGDPVAVAVVDGGVAPARARVERAHGGDVVGVHGG